MHATAFLAGPLFAALTLADDVNMSMNGGMNGMMSMNLQVDAKDVPQACMTICKPVVELTTTCNPMDMSKMPMNGNMPGMNMKKGMPMEGDSGDDHDMIVAMEAAVADCTCMNKSFQVAGLTAMCASCMSMNMGKLGGVDAIMSLCNFPPMTYTPASDSMAMGITVQATKPTIDMGKMSGNTNKSAADRLAGSVVGAVVVAFTALLAM